MIRDKFVSSTLIFLLSVSMLSLLVILFPTVPANAAPSRGKIIFPFTTGWENDGRSPQGRTNAIDWNTNDFYGYSGSGTATLGTGVCPTTPPSIGYDFGSRQLDAEGYFGGGYSYCYFNLFDQTANSDYGGPVRLLNHTFINIWYCHFGVPCCMIDAQLYNPHKNQWWTLRDFQDSSGHFIVDQNNVRIHAAARRNDAVNIWKFSSFDLTMIYQDDPGNWYITKIWIAFDNDPRFGSTVTGQAKTYFDILNISYGVGGITTKYFSGALGSTSERTIASVVAAYWTSGGPDLYDLFLRVSFYSNVSFTGSYIPQCPIKNSINVTNLPRGDVGVETGGNNQPAGFNLTSPDPNPKMKQYGEWACDAFTTAVTEAIGWYGTAIEGIMLADRLVGIIMTPPPPEYSYQWRDAIAEANLAHWAREVGGEVYLKIAFHASGTYNINLNLRSEFWTWIYFDPVFGWFYNPDNVLTVSMSIPWTTPDIDTTPPGGQPSVSITYPSNGQTFRPGATFTASANVYPPACYLLTQQILNGHTGYVFTKMTDSAGNPVSGYDWQNMTCNQRLTETEDEGGTFAFNYDMSGLTLNRYYYIYVTTRATNDQSQTTSMSIYYYNNAPYDPVWTSGPTTVVRNVWYKYATNAVTDPDGDIIRYHLNVTGPGNPYQNTTAWVSSGTPMDWNLLWEPADHPGTYLLQAWVEDSYGALSHMASLSVNMVNRAPNQASSPSGSTVCYVYSNWNYRTPYAGYAYTTNASDSDGDSVKFDFIWAYHPSPYAYIIEGNNTSGLYPSGTNVTMSHVWTRPGPHVVLAMSIDNYGLPSNVYITSATIDVRQDDDGTGGDAGDNFTKATIYNPSHDVGTLYNSTVNDPQDWYQFYAESGQTISTWLSSTGGSNFDLQLYDNNTVLRASSTSTSSYDYISYAATSTGFWRIRIYNVTGEGMYYFGVSVYTPGPPGGCPILYTYDGNGYVVEGLLNIHDSTGTDIIANRTLTTTPARVRGTYEFLLVEHPQTISQIDQVKLYAVLQDGKTIELPLVYAWHSEYRNVLPQLQVSDEWKTTELGANHNDGVSQTIELRFRALPPTSKIRAFIFQIEGNNWIVKV